MNACHFPQRQRGAALIIALVIVAIAIILTTQLVWKTHLDQRRVENQLYGGQAIAYALGAEDWAREILMRDEAAIDHLGEDWAARDAHFPIEGGTLVGNITDLQGRFNLNNLVDDAQLGEEDEVRGEQLEALRNLLATHGAKETIADAVLDWQDPGIEPSGMGGMEDSAYSRQVPAYVTPNGPLFSASELRAIGDITAEEYNAVRDLVTALPKDGAPENGTTINVNTAPATVLQATAEGLGEADTTMILEFRQQGGIKDLAELESLLGPSATGEPRFPAERFSVTSNWFLLTVRAQIGSSSVTMYSVLRRDPELGVVETVARTLGTY